MNLGENKHGLHQLWRMSCFCNRDIININIGSVHKLWDRVKIFPCAQSCGLVWFDDDISVLNLLLMPKEKKKRKERKREVILTAFFNERGWLFHLCRFSYEWRWEKEKFTSLVALNSCPTHLCLNKFGVAFASKKLEHKILLTNMSLRSPNYQTVGNFMIYFVSGQWY